MLTLFHLRKQLEKEQEPFVVSRDDITFEKNSFRIKLKNVGRGPAFNITGCRTSNKEDRNSAFFMNNQPHSKNLCANNTDTDGEKHWRVDKSVIDSLAQDESEKIYRFFYFFYESQLGTVYYTKVKIKPDGDNFIVMENKRVKL